MTPVSACLIVQDEQERLGDCLSSLAFCDEIVVVDGGSRDGTVELARAAHARVIEHPWAGFAAQRNVALEHASHDWVLELDADERVSEPLRREIEAFLADPPEGIDICVLPMRHEFLGRWLERSARYPMYRNRLFRRSRYRHDETRAVHEGLWADGPARALSGDMEHVLARSLREALVDRWRYARLEAMHVTPPTGARSYLVGIAVRPALKATWRIAGLGGWRDGWQGLLHIGLECASDSVVWVRLLARHLYERDAAPGPTGHYSRQAHRGPARVVALADGAAAARARSWLEGVQREGGDPALIAPGMADINGLHVRTVRKLGFFEVVRALDAEQQLRPIDALVAFGSHARLLTKMLPAPVRQRARTLPAATPAAQAVERALAARREGVR